MASPWQCSLPDSLLLEIFYFLDLPDLARVSRVCRLWFRVVQDSSVWHHLAIRKWFVKGNLKTGKSSWKEEVKRLHCHVPLLETNCIEKHTDEVLDVAISSDGKYFCTASKDASIVMWDLADPTECISEVNTSKDLNWMLTQYSLFNDDNSRVLICGVRNLTAEQEQNNFEPQGCGAVYTVPDLQLVSLILLEPFTLFGAWLDTTIFIAGLADEERDCIHMRAYDSVNEFLPKKNERLNIEQHAENLLGHYAQHQTGLFSYEGSRLHQMNVITARVPRTRHVTNIDKNLQQDCGQVSSMGGMICDSGANTCTVSEESVVCHTNVYTNTQSENTLYDDIEGAESIADRDRNCSKVTNNSLRNHPLYDDVKMYCDNGMNHPDNSHRKPLELPYRTYVIVVAGEHDVIQMFEVTEDHITDIRRQFAERTYISETSVVQPDHVFHIEQNYITGLTLSPDHRYAFFNHREMTIRKTCDGEFSERVFSQELKIGIIDLVTMARVKDVEYKGHVGFSNYSPWYICLDVSQDFIVSGSEDGCAYVWEKNYNACLGILEHRNGVVNGVAFSLVDQETCVTVCDDKLIKVWRSKHRLKQFIDTKMKQELNKFSFNLLARSNQTI